MKYPEHEKLRAVKQDSQRLGEFLEWLDEQGLCIARYDEDKGLVPEWHRAEQWLADYFEIDLQKIGAEKDAMLDELRAANSADRECECANSLNFGEPAPDCSACGGTGRRPRDKKPHGPVFGPFDTATAQSKDATK